MSTVWVATPSGADIAVHSLGGTGCPLLFAPANGFHGMCYQAVASGLRQHYECWGIDLEGQGDSPEAADCSTNMLQRHADDLLAVMDRLACRGTCYVFGHSGGGLAAVIAEQQRPGSFRAMFLFEPMVAGPASTAGDKFTNDFVDEAFIQAQRGADSARLLSSMTLRRRRVFPSKAAALDSFAAKPLFKKFRRDVLEDYVQHGLRDLPDGTVELKCAPASEARVYTDVWVACGDAFAGLPSIACPVTVAAGSEAALGGKFLAPEPEAPRVAAHLPNGRFEKYATVGHLGPFEDPAFVADRVLFNLHFSEKAAMWKTLPKTELIKMPRAQL